MWRVDYVSRFAKLLSRFCIDGETVRTSYWEGKIMIPETSVNWKAFEYKFSDNPQRAFENLTYYLFCDEYGQKNGIFRYFN